MLPTRLCLVRHGETAWNAERRIQGQLDVPLSAIGRAQARAVAAALQGRAIAAIYSSDLVRALDTARAAAARLGLPLRRRPGLRERHYGALQALTYAEFADHYPEAHARLRAREEDFVLPGGGESLRAFAARVHACLDGIVAAHPGQCVLVVTHGGVLDVAYRRACGRPLAAPRDFEIANAAFNWLEAGPGSWRLLAWAERSHLAEALDELPG